MLSVCILYIVLCKPMVASCFQCVLNNHTKKVARIILIFYHICLNAYLTVDRFMSEVSNTIDWP